MANECIVIDTQLLVLLAAGNASRSIIRRHKRLYPKYDSRAYDLLIRILSGARKVLVTPGVLTETSNLIRQTAEPDRKCVMAAFRDLIDGADELHVASKVVARSDVFIRLGFTDAALLETDAASVLLTDDLHLYLAAERAGRLVMNFNHAREADR